MPAYGCPECNVWFESHTDQQRHWLARHGPQAPDPIARVEIIGPSQDSGSMYIGRIGYIIGHNQNSGAVEVRLPLHPGWGRIWFPADSVREWSPAPTDDPEALELWLDA